MSVISAKPSETAGSLGSADKNKQWQRELLMERLRRNSSQHKTFQELSKAMRMSVLEKRYALDAVEKANLQKCLDSMQHCIKVTTRQGLIERLESLSRQLGLKFMEDTSGLFISSDMFYLEIILDANGNVSDVKVHHECKIEQQSCSELVTCLLKGDFADFTTQLEGLSSIYQLNAEPKVKSKAFVALQAMETDLYNLFMIQNFHKDTHMVLLESSVGIVQKRRGGHPMKLTFFVPPYELLDLETKTMSPLSLEVLSTKNVGISVTVNLEASSANKLQTSPTVTFNKDSQVPLYSPMTPTNSLMLPATFVLRLNNPLPLCRSLIQSIVLSTDMNFGDGKYTSIMDLIVKTASNDLIQNSSKGLFVNLPDQTHCYFLSENRQMQGTVVTSVPFTEPSQVPKILSALRQQALFYTLLASCVRPQSRFSDIDNTTMLEVNATSIHQISVALEHPYEESMATVEFDLSDVTNVVCRIYSLTSNYDVMAVKLSKIAQKCLSIPITIRSLLKFWEQERMKGFHRSIENGNFNLPLGPNDPGGRPNDMRDMKGKGDRGPNSAFGGNGRQFFHPSGVMMSSVDNFGENNMSIFESSSESVMQFSMKGNHEMGFNESNNVKDCPVGEDFYKSPKSKTDFSASECLTENSDSNSLGTFATLSDSGVANSNLSKILKQETENTSLFANIKNAGSISERRDSDCADYEDIEEKLRKLHGEKQPNETSPQPSMSGLGFSSVLSGMGLERRPGIEIIPVTTVTPQTTPTTSITITPIGSTRVDKKSSSKSRSDEKSKSERKRKRRKEDSAMGPPDKIMSKSDSSNRSYNSSSKSSDGSQSSDGGSSATSGKYSSSPKILAFNSARASPKNSPIHSSPKHIASGTHSPKGMSYVTSSPKHGSSSSTGKPSLSALKNAANSPSSKSDKSYSKLLYRDKEKERDRDRDRERSGKGASSPKIKSSTVKLKQIDLSAAFLPASDQVQYDEMSGVNVNSTCDTYKTASTSTPTLNCNNQNKVRKGCLSAVIDKLKSAQNTGDEQSGNQAPLHRITDVDGSPAAGGVIRDKSGNINSHSKTMGSISNLTFKPSSGISGPLNQSSEYMVKPSLDGMKITINKTRTKDTANSKNASSHSSKLSSSGSGGSPKRHTGLKPGVNSGPASKKAQISQSSIKASPFPSQSSNTPHRSNFQKSNSSGNLSTKNSFPSTLIKSASSNSFSSSDLLKKDKSNKSKAGPAEKPTDVMKLLRCVSSPHSIDAMGFMKSFNSKFQIPKLSARQNDESKKDPSRVISSSAPNTPVSTCAPSPPATSSGSSSGSSNSSSNESSTKTTNFSEFVSKDLSSKLNFQTSKLSTEITSSTASSHQQSIASKIAPYILSATLPKFPDNAGMHFPKDATQIPKSLSSETLSNAFQRDYPMKSMSSSTPCTPVHVTSSPFASPIGTLLMNNTSPAFRPSPVASPNVSQIEDMSMRPPSAPYSAEVIRTTELDLTMKSDSKNIDPRVMTQNATVCKKTSPSTNPTPKMPFPASPSVSVHILKSPVQSPLMVMPSPHSNSPCITDDELMDEALVGIGGK